MPPDSLLLVAVSAPHFLFNPEHSLKSLYLPARLFIVNYLPLPPDFPAKAPGRQKSKFVPF